MNYQIANPTPVIVTDAYVQPEYKGDGQQYKGDGQQY